MRISPWFSLIFFLLASSASFGCECLWQGPFNAALPEADIVVKGTVSQRQGNSLDLTVDEYLQGEDYRDTLRIWGKKDDLCRPEVENFPIGSQWVMALQRINTVPEDGFDPFRPNISYGRKEDYSLSSCGVYWLQVNSGRVSGNIVAGSRWQYEDKKKSPVLLSLFKSWLNGDIGDQQIAEASKPRPEARQLLNNTRIFLLQQRREESKNAEAADETEATD